MPLLAAILAGIVAQAPATSLAVTIEPRFESLRYRFDNPSTFDTAELVPHFFEQTYDTDNVWLGARFGFRLWTVPSETQAAFTPVVTGRADDLDTFFNPGDNVIVSGTVGNASLRGWRVSQHVVVGRWSSVRYGLAYRYRRDTARFHEGTKIVRTSNPPGETRETVTTREFVTSQIHEAQWFVRWAPDASWLSLDVDVSPFALGRLGVELPDKYPGRTLVFRARAATVGGQATVRRTIGRMALELSARADRSFSYRQTARMRLQGVSVVVRAGTR